MGKIDINRLDICSFFKNGDNLVVKYNKKRDILLLQVKNCAPAISVDYEGIFWVRINPETNEVVGIEIEGYHKVFIKKCHELNRMTPSTNQPFVDNISRELVGCLS